MNEINLNRVDYAQVGTLSKKCMKILPSGQANTQQRVTVGAHNGIVFCFGRKKTDTIISFKTLPGPKIDGLVLGGALGTPQDKIFVAAGNTVKGYSKKGTQFFGFETNLTEPIMAMCVYGVDMFLCTNYTFNHYHDCKDANYFLCGDKINDVTCLPVIEGGGWVGRGVTPVLACDDRTLKVINGSSMTYAIEVGGTPSILHLYQNNGGVNGYEIIYGTKDGKIGLAELPPADPQIKWEILSPNGSSGIMAIDCYDIAAVGQQDLIVGRDDGVVEIYYFDDSDRPTIRQTFNCNESIIALQCGKIGSSNFDEIVVATYAGWIFGLTTEPIHKEVSQAQSQTPLARAPNPELEAKIQQLRQELEQLQLEINSERERYQQKTTDENGFSAVPVFAINDKFTLNRDEAAYTLSMELQVAIDYVLLQCDVPADLMDVEKNSAVVSLTVPEPNSGNSLLATYRCQANTTRLEMKLRSIEGQYGILQAYIAPRLHPKTCQLRQYQIKPLSLHQRAHTYDESRPQNVMKISGTFSMAEAHSWVVFCLPDIPDKPPIAEKAVLDLYKLIAVDICDFSKGSCVFRTDSISTIAILKDVMSKEATKKKTRLDIACEIDDESVIHGLKLLHPKLEYQLDLAKKVHLIDALKELTINESDTSFLAGEYLDILKSADRLQSDFKKQQAHLERIYDMYIDKFKFKGQNVKHKVTQLLQLLDNYSLESLIEFFNGK